MADTDTRSPNCGYKCGSLPDCAPLAIGTIPAQRSALPQYKKEKALARGTLFPGLDLPLGNIVNTDTADVPMAELMAIDFACHDLSLYLDTHAEDQEAFETYQELLRLAEDGRERYVSMYGPITKKDLKNEQRYSWLKGPWPWNYPDNRRG